MRLIILCISLAWIPDFEGKPHSSLEEEIPNNFTHVLNSTVKNLNETSNSSQRGLSDDLFIHEDFLLDGGSEDYLDEIKESTSHGRRGNMGKNGEFFGVQLLMDADVEKADANALKQCWKWCKNQLQYFSSLDNIVQPLKLAKKRYKLYQTNYFMFKDRDRNLINTVQFNTPDNNALPIIQGGNLCVCYFSRDNPSANLNWFISNHETINDVESWINANYHFEKDGSIVITSGFQNTSENFDNSLMSQELLDETQSHETESVQKIHWIACLISAISLAFAFIISLTVDNIKKQLNLLFQCHMLMLLCGYLNLVFKHWIHWPAIPVPCFVSSVLGIFFFLSAYFWTNTQALEMIILLQHKCPILAAGRALRRFFFYSCYSWGIAFIIAISSAIAEARGSINFSPGFKKECWFFDNRKGLGFLYFYGWIAFILAVNLILTILILKKFHQKSKDDPIPSKHPHRHMLRIFVQLVVVMGFSWILKVIAWGLGRNDNLVFLDVISDYQGLFVLIVYAFKPNLLQKLYHKVFQEKQRPVCHNTENPSKNLWFFQRNG